MNRLIVPAAFVAGVTACLIMAATSAPETTPAPAPAAVQTLNGSEATPDITVAPCGVTDLAYTRTDVCFTPDGQVTPVAPPTSAPTPDPVQTLNAPVGTFDPPVTPPAETPAATPAPVTCAPWMEPGWSSAPGVGSSCLWAMPNEGSTLELPACPTEDSENCYWDATIRGNDQGQSFVNIQGHIFTEEG